MLKKLYLGFTVIICLIIAGGSISYYNTWMQQQHAEQMTKIDYPKINLIHEILFEINKNQDLIYKGVITNDSGFLLEILPTVEKAGKLALQMVQTEKDPRKKAEFESLKKLVDDYYQKLKEASVQKTPFTNEIATKLIGFGNLAAEQAEKIEEETVESFFHDNIDTAARMVQNKKVYLILILLGVLISISIAVSISFSITRSIQTLIHGANRIASGDLNYEINIEEKNEIGKVAVAFKKMTTTMQELMAEEQTNRKRAEEAQKMAETLRANLQEQVSELLRVVDTAAQGDLTVTAEIRGEDEMSRLSGAFSQMIDNLRNLVSQIQQAGFQINTSSTEIVAASEEQVRGSNEQSIQVNATTTAVEELSTAARQISENSQSVVKESELAIKATKTGVDIIENAIEGMNRMRRTVEGTAKKIMGLGEKSQRIGNIVKIINDIAEQTNLLALNASIEAARAGEQGKGFAVVADEVGKLAEKSARATSDISSLINEIQAATNATVLSMEGGTKEVEKATRLVEDAGDVLKNIESAIRTAAQRAKEISLATQQQTTGSEQVALAMQTIQEVTKQSGVSSKQSATAARQLQDLVVELKNAVDRFTLIPRKKFGMQLRQDV